MVLQSGSLTATDLTFSGNKAVAGSGGAVYAGNSPTIRLTQVCVGLVLGSGRLGVWCSWQYILSWLYQECMRHTCKLQFSHGFCWLGNEPC